MSGFPPAARDGVPPRRVLLFSGHRVDAPGRLPPRFPPGRVPAAARAIAAALEGWHAGPQDLALTQGAAGGDLLFAEACADRGVRVQLLQPLDDEAFAAASLLPSQDGAQWLARWQALRQRLRDAPQRAGDALGPPAPGEDAFERGNRWLLAAALAHGAARLHLLCLWDGAAGDGPGGTAHLVQAARACGATVLRIDPRRLADGA